jgi:hypothetical protein
MHGRCGQPNAQGYDVQKLHMHSQSACLTALDFVCNVIVSVNGVCTTLQSTALVWIEGPLMGLSVLQTFCT